MSALTKFSPKCVPVAAPGAMCRHKKNRQALRLPVLVGCGLILPAGATGAVATRAGLVDLEGTIVELEAIDGFDCGVSFIRTGHGHETKTAGAAGLTIGDDSDFFHSAKFFELGAESIFSGRIRHVSNVDLQLFLLRGVIATLEQTCAEITSTNNPSATNAELRREAYTIFLKMVNRNEYFL